MGEIKMIPTTLTARWWRPRLRCFTWICIFIYSEEPWRPSTSIINDMTWLHGGGGEGGGVLSHRDRKLKFEAKIKRTHEATADAQILQESWAGRQQVGLFCWGEIIIYSFIHQSSRQPPPPPPGWLSDPQVWMLHIVWFQWPSRCDTDTQFKHRISSED